MDKKLLQLAATILTVLAVTACAPFQQYRTVYPEVCVSPTPAPSPDCESHALQQLPTGNGNHYLLGFIEFDDQGQLWDRRQMTDVVGKLAGEAGTKELLMVVFVHGWKHSAARSTAPSTLMSASARLRCRRRNVKPTRCNSCRPPTAIATCSASSNSTTRASFGTASRCRRWSGSWRVRPARKRCCWWCSCTAGSTAPRPGTKTSRLSARCWRS